MIQIALHSEQELIRVIESNPCIEILPEQSFRKTRYIDQKEFDDLVQYNLCYEPYLSIAKRCLMSEIQVMRSINTNRFYIGFVNLGGHRAMYEVRPVRMPEMMDSGYMEKMYADYGRELDSAIDLTESYTI